MVQSCDKIIRTSANNTLVIVHKLLSNLEGDSVKAMSEKST